MYIKDLLKLLEHHWLSDRSIFLHERQRVQLSALILILAFMLSRPGAIIESDGAVSTDKALSYGNVRVFIIRKPSKSDRNVIIMEITCFCQSVTNENSSTSRETRFPSIDQTLLRPDFLP